ncbi:hypothetical protein SC1083_2056 [Aggregatibacter actinomycetemcomitans serotype e str. SC1083]|uniref:Uncharacterized protein n=1 Tax=Aggregatibacter actinomycetemcomitans serotype e str. SC1083 TaxID=907488 RepID=G4AB26_AGGAC|nr:hypothetical protein SC1083_2056 [Aggregatibacter actinomycetemcomitans serotype e str. SC1083]
MNILNHLFTQRLIFCDQHKQKIKRIFITDNIQMLPNRLLGNGYAII